MASALTQGKQQLEIGGETIDECLFLLRSHGGTLDYGTDKSFAPELAVSRQYYWHEALKGNCAELIKRRLRRQRIQSRELLAKVGNLAVPTPGGGWIKLLETLLQDAAPQEYERSYPFEVNQHPFGRVLWPICAKATSMLEATTQVPDSVLVGLQDWLLERLTGFIAPSLYLEFVRLRDGDRSQVVGSFARFERESQTWLRQFFLTRPPLARLVTTIVRNWIDACVEFSSRLTRDIIALRSISGVPSCAIKGVVAGLSDPHDCGRTVIRVELESGRRFYYKPRPLTREIAWEDALTWLTRHGGTIFKGYPRIIVREDYGWQEECVRSECSSAANYYYNLGTQLALMRIVGTSDMHHENVIAYGDNAVFIDLDSLGAPAPRLRRRLNPANAAARRQLLQSVWRTGVLPDATFLPGGEVMAFGALCENPGMTARAWTFEAINSDRMRFVLRSLVQPTFLNMPLGKDDTSPRHYSKEVARGFLRTLRLVKSNWSSFSKLDIVEPGGARLIFRPTAVYAAALQAIRDPRAVTNGIEWSGRLELMSDDRGDLVALANPALLATERLALTRGDIPYFKTTDGEQAECEGDIVAPCEFTSAKRAKPLGRRAIARDLALIRFAIGSRVGESSLKWESTSYAGKMSREELITEAKNILHIIAARAVLARGYAAWWGRVALGPAASIRILGPGLYDGISGITLFISAAAAALNDAAAKNLAAAAFRSIHASVRRHRHSPAFPERTIGFAVGMSGVVFAAARAARFADDDSAISVARSAARHISLAAIEGDRSYDLLSGSAGALIALLELWQLTHEAEWMHLASRCGEHLLHGAIGHYCSARRPIGVGMAHGIAGIGFAMARLGRISGESRYLEAAMEALEEADHWYDESEGDWPNDRSQSKDKPIFWCRWCQGALGVGLAWNEVKSECPGQATKVVNRALRAALERPPRAVDNLCCGNAGNIDFLWHLGDTEPSLRLIARHRAESLIASRRSEGYRFEDAPAETTLGLYSGMAGVGYMLLRITGDHGLPYPSLLAFQ